MPERLTERIQLILDESRGVLNQVQREPIEQLIAGLVEAEQIFVFGQGRTGHVSRAFAVRLMHLGLTVHFVGDTTTPPITPRDLCLVNSGTGETRFAYHVAAAAKEAGARVATITAHPHARIARMADIVVHVPAPTKGEVFGPRASRQPAGSLFEQACFVILEAIVLMLLDRLEVSPSSMLKRHANIE